MSQTPVTLRFGKEALTDAWLEELRDQLHRRGQAKVRFLAAGRGDKAIRDWASDVARLADARLIDVRGHTVTFESNAGPHGAPPPASRSRGTEARGDR